MRVFFYPFTEKLLYLSIMSCRCLVFKVHCVLYIRTLLFLQSVEKTKLFSLVNPVLRCKRSFFVVEMRRVRLRFANPTCSTTEHFVSSTRFAPLAHKTVYQTVLFHRSCLSEFVSPIHSRGLAQFFVVKGPSLWWR